MTRLAVLVIAYRSPIGLAVLSRYFENLDADVFVHVDAKASLDSFRNAVHGAGRAVMFLPDRRRIYWGGWTMVEATVALLRTALAHGGYDRLMLLSDDSLPLLPPDALRARLSVGHDLMSGAQASAERFRRYQEFFMMDSDATQPRTLPLDQRVVTEDALARLARLAELRGRGKKPVAAYYHGSQWMALTEASARRVLEIYDSDPWLRESFEFSSVPDEAFFHTILLSYKGAVHRPVMFSDWSRPVRPWTFTTAAELRSIVPNQHLFVRKTELSAHELDVYMQHLADVARTTAQAPPASPWRRGALPGGVGPLLNLAVNKPALQSSVSAYSIGRTPEEDARGGNNGYLSPRYAMHTETEANPWWQVDLQDVFRIGRVIIFNRVEQAARLKNFTILGALDGSDWKTLFSNTDDSVFGGDTPFTAEIAGAPLARFVRVRLDGVAPLHFRECQVFGAHPDASVHERLLRQVAEAARVRDEIPAGRRGRVVEVDGLAVFVDEEKYDAAIVGAIGRGDYEATERQLVAQTVTHVDRVIEIGTGIGLVAMTAARIVGAERVVTYDANPDILGDARDNFRRNGLGGIASHVAVLRNRGAIRHPDETATFHVARAFWASRLDAPAGDRDIVRTLKVPIRCLEDAISDHAATVLVCDIEGGEVALLSEADLSGIRLIVMETHYREAGEAATDQMLRSIIQRGFSLNLALSVKHIVVLRRDAT